MGAVMEVSWLQKVGMEPRTCSDTRKHTHTHKDAITKTRRKSGKEGQGNHEEVTDVDRHIQKREAGQWGTPTHQLTHPTH